MIFDAPVRYADVHWGTHGCQLLGVVEGERCWRPAALLWDVDDRDRGIPACVLCADYLLERRELVGRGVELGPLLLP